MLKARVFSGFSDVSRCIVEGFKQKPSGLDHNPLQVQIWTQIRIFGALHRCRQWHCVTLLVHTKRTFHFLSELTRAVFKPSDME